MSKSSLLTLLGLHVLLGLYSLSDVCSKAAAGQEFFNFTFIALWLAILFLLGIYAIGWQQVIKRMPLTTAYANRAITIVWGIFWGCLLFGESVTIGKSIGAAIIIAGIIVFVKSSKPEELS